jgi:small subunit ribosomal protein S6
LEAGTKKLYEGMFLVDSAHATADWEGVLAAIRTILERAEAEIVSLRKWDERKLAYNIGGKNRGTYILVYFNAEGRKITDIERDVRLSDKVMRALILNAESAYGGTPKDVPPQLSAKAEAGAAMKTEKSTDLASPDVAGYAKAGSGKPSGHGTPAVPGENQKGHSAELSRRPPEETVSAGDADEGVPGTA